MKKYSLRVRFLIFIGVIVGSLGAAIAAGYGVIRALRALGVS